MSSVYNFSINVGDNKDGGKNSFEIAWEKVHIWFIPSSTLGKTQIEIDGSPHHVQFLTKLKRKELIDVAKEAGCQLTVTPENIMFMSIKREAEDERIEHINKFLPPLIENVYDKPLLIEKKHQANYMACLSNDPPECVKKQHVAIFRECENSEKFFVVGEHHVIKDANLQLLELLREVKRGQKYTRYSDGTVVSSTSSKSAKTQQDVKLVAAQVEMFQHLHFSQHLENKYQQQVQCNLDGSIVTIEGPADLVIKCKQEVESMVSKTPNISVTLDTNLDKNFLSKEKVHDFIMEELEKENIPCDFRIIRQSAECIIYALDDDILEKAKHKIHSCMGVAKFSMAEMKGEKARKILGEYSDVIEHSPIKEKSRKECVVIGLPYAITEIEEKMSRLRESLEDDHGVCKEKQSGQHVKDEKPGVSVGDMDRKISVEPAKSRAEGENVTEDKHDLSSQQAWNQQEPVVPGYDLHTDTKNAKIQQETMQMKPLVSGAVLGNSRTNLDKSSAVSNKPLVPGYAWRVSDGEKDTWDANELKEGETDLQGDGMSSVKSVVNKDATFSHSRSGHGDVADCLPSRKESDFAAGEQLWSNDSSKKSDGDVSSINKHKAQIDYCMYAFLSQPFAKRTIDECLKENFKGTLWRVWKEDEAFYLYTNGPSSENCKEVIQYIQKSVKEECISKAIYRIAQEPLSKLDCCLYMYGMEDDTTDNCIITALTEDMPRIKQTLDQASVKEQEKGDAVAYRTRSKTSQAGGVQENVSESRPPLPPKSPKDTTPTPPPRTKKESKTDNKPPCPQKPDGNADEIYLKFEDHLVNCLFERVKEEVEALKKKFQVTIQKSVDGIKLEGTSKSSLRKAAVKVEEVIKQLKTKNLELNVPSNLVTEEDVQAVIQKVAQPVHIQVDGLDNREPEYFYSWSSDKMPVCLIITHGKVENTKVDSIVVPCNGDLSPSCEVAWSIFRKG